MPRHKKAHTVRPGRAKRAHKAVDEFLFGKPGGATRPKGAGGKSGFRNAQKQLEALERQGF